MSSKPIRIGNKDYHLMDDEALSQLKRWMETSFNWSGPIDIEDLRKAVMDVAKQNTINSLDFKMSREDRQRMLSLRNNKKEK